MTMNVMVSKASTGICSKVGSTANVLIIANAGSPVAMVLGVVCVLSVAWL